jgi:hypothetical protein
MYTYRHEGYKLSPSCFEEPPIHLPPRAVSPWLRREKFWKDDPLSVRLRSRHGSPLCGALDMARCSMRAATCTLVEKALEERSVVCSTPHGRQISAGRSIRHSPIRCTRHGPQPPNALEEPSLVGSAPQGLQISALLCLRNHSASYIYDPRHGAIVWNLSYQNILTRQADA